ncbi:MAG: hypothetical protein HYU36_15145 [Planctomycetes bacterium]|nr:hypothetical protein [Planctomycetota bacterium]
MSNRFVNYDDLARLEYGRMLWRNVRVRAMLIEHWSDPRHPYRERFLANRRLIEHVLEYRGEEAILEHELRGLGTSLRAMMREIPPVFGSFWPGCAQAHEGQGARTWSTNEHGRASCRI